MTAKFKGDGAGRSAAGEGVKDGGGNRVGEAAVAPGTPAEGLGWVFIEPVLHFLTRPMPLSAITAIASHKFVSRIGCSGQN